MSNKIQNIVLGTDPEAFLRNRKTKEIVSAIGLIPGTKHAPYPITELGPGYFIQTDNVMVEWCVPATNNYRELYHSIQKCIEYTNSVIPGDLEVTVKASAFLDEKYLQNEQALTFGCDPDFNAWTYMMNSSPSSRTNLRTAGGHIHIGYDNPDDDASIELIRALDLYLGVPSIILDPDIERRKMYGKAGAFRIKSYGIEYRSLSNFWIKDHLIIKFIYNGVKKAVEFVNTGKSFTDEDQLMIQAAINGNDRSLARNLISKYKLEDVMTRSLVID